MIKKRIKIKCLYCNLTFERVLSYIKRNKRNFCSKVCWYKWRVQSGNVKRENNPNWKGGFVKVKCLNCDKEYEKAPSSIRKHNYCSRKCKDVWQSNEKQKGENHHNWKGGLRKIKCDYCNLEFVRKPSAIDNHHGKKCKNNFCSVQCKGQWQSENYIGEKNPGYKGGKIKYRGQNWKKQRKKALDRDAYICCNCKKFAVSGREPDVHHIKKFRVFGMKRYKEANNINNLITLCYICHKRLENKPEKCRELLKKGE